jgi:hypothetical protein
LPIKIPANGGKSEAPANDAGAWGLVHLQSRNPSGAGRKTN